MRSYGALPGARALVGTMGTRQDAMDREMDRLGRADLMGAQTELARTQADARRREIDLAETMQRAALDARARRGEAGTLEQALRLRMPDADPGQLTALVRRSQGGPYAAPTLSPEQMRMAGETASGIFASSLADKESGAGEIAKIIFDAGSSAQRLSAPDVAKTDPNRGAFMLNAGAGNSAPDLYGAIPGGLGTFGSFTGEQRYDPGLYQSRLAEERAKAAASNASAASSYATAGKTRAETDKMATIWDADRGGLIDWRTGQMRPVTTPEGAPIGPKAQAAAKPTFDSARGLMIDPVTGEAKPVTVDGQPIGNKPLSPADQARIDKRNREAGAARSALDQSLSELDRLGTIAREVKDHPGLEGITGLTGVLPKIPGSDRANAQAKLETLKSQVAFRVLQTMRDMSKTGGALGQVSDRENTMLQNNLAALDQAQSYEEFQRELGRIIDFVDGVKGRMEQAYTAQYGASDAPPNLPRAGEVVDGYRFRGGDPADPASWEPIE